jgi:hypothetical protein
MGVSWAILRVRPPTLSWSLFQCSLAVAEALNRESELLQLEAMSLCWEFDDCGLLYIHPDFHAISISTPGTT